MLTSCSSHFEYASLIPALFKCSLKFRALCHFIVSMMLWSWSCWKMTIGGFHILGQLPPVCGLCMLSCFSFVILCDSMDSSLPGSSEYGILWARILEWVAMSFSLGNLPDPGIGLGSLTSPAVAGGLFTTSTTWEGYLLSFHLLPKALS